MFRIDSIQLDRPPVMIGSACFARQLSTSAVVTVIVYPVPIEPLIRNSDVRGPLQTERYYGIAWNVNSPATT